MARVWLGVVIFVVFVFVWFSCGLVDVVWFCVVERSDDTGSIAAMGQPRRMSSNQLVRKHHMSSERQTMGY